MQESPSLHDAARLLEAFGWSLSTDPPSAGPEAAPAWTDQTGTLEVLRAGTGTPAAFLLRFFGEDFAWVEPEARRIRLCPEGGRLGPAAVVHLLADQVLPRALAQEGRLVLHAGGVVLDGRAVLVLGDSGWGKSTLTARLGQAGGRVLSDDAMILEEAGAGASARPVYAGLRLLPDSLAALFDRTGGTPVAEYTDKARLAVEPPDDPGPVPLAMILVLRPPVPASRVELARLSPLEACMAMLRNSFALDPGDRAQGARRLGRFGALAARVPAFALSYPRDYALLAEVAEAVLRRLGSLDGPGPA
ncbi:Serine kinase of the HPr protein, regulates carbohydrate metabolism [Rubellimicrobium mesophilum DSM 19309]|uniref:Serine kinase of the HPr protein, regulates carbohydrate metabolism n=1 Tax=Rubellimicrobium mesophilum DSM 19309 TaxID=442562 RepID=A0A017HKS3_9RHOB|nr:hypothetical protein [Rubellimicrobium mesophilum]EYD75057.1 Serine kinase of the HPr protein, regulates carbohydrate metabolism [Rubellimicrobium mesophilum DSM 19309]